MPRHNAAEAMPVPEPKAAKPEKKKKHLKLVENTEEIQLKDSDLEEIEDLTHEAKEDTEDVTELKESDLEEIEDLTHEARRIKDEAAMQEARKNLEAIPDMTQEARLMDEGDRVEELTAASARKAQVRSADEVYPMDNTIARSTKPKTSLLSRIKGWFGGK
ncbi:MAG: hypothetical protein QY323_05795 [Patescibacteria group bacterium]|nr:MAG: hypothetical protein QY323_05795 [Patescibacteria group bacterium]